MIHLDEIRPQYQDGGKPKRVKRNDSPTRNASEQYEDRTARHIQYFNASKINHDYDIPYIDSLEITIPGVGRVSTNALDSIAKYAYEARIPLSDAIGLAAQETALGAIPYLNYNNDTTKTKEQRTAINRALGNTSYFRNYGSIPANYLVRDWAYFNLSDEQRANTPPLLHAFNYWKKGNYNRNDKNHTQDVKNKGQKVINTPVIKEWIKGSKYAQRALKYKKP